MEKILRVYPTKIEIYPYSKGEFPDIEKMCSTEYDRATHSRHPIGFDIDNNTLYLIRGMNIQQLSNLTESIPTMYKGVDSLPMKKQYKMKTAPRNDNQKEAIEFLIGANNHRKTKRYSQLVLNVQPGFGKTYCSVFAMMVMCKKTIIILHREIIRDQWISCLKDHTTMNMNRVCEIQGSEFMKELTTKKNLNKYDVYLVLHPTIASFERTYGKNELREWFDAMRFGLKITDEVHYSYYQTISTDFCSNIEKNFYLTATFTRSDRKETRIFARTFANSIKFGDELDVIKNVVYNIIFYNSNPSVKEQAMIKTYYGLSSIRFADYAFSRDPYATAYIVFLKVLKTALKQSGKIIVVVPKIEYCEKLAEMISNEYPDKNVNTIHSKKTKKEKEDIKENAEIIISTISSLGTGADIDKIRSLIIIEPYSSKVIAKQLTGRLRPYNNEDSYVYELIDCGFDQIISMVNRRERYLKEICKEVNKFKI